MLGNLRENRVLSSGAYHVTGGCNKRRMVDFGLLFARAACLRILPQWLSSFTVTLSIFTLAFVFSLNTINTARADVCFLPNAKGCEQVPYNEYLCTGDDCPEPEITCEASNNCYETEAAAMSARDVKDSYYKNDDCWCLKDSCPSSIYNIADKGEGWNCSGQCTDEKSKNYGKYSLCSPKACSKGTTDCSASDCKICQNTNPVEYSGDYVCQESVDVVAYCPDDYPLTEAPNGCYNETDKKCGEGKCYQSYNLKCDGEHQIVTGSGTACSCGCEAGYKMGDNGCEESNCFSCGVDCTECVIKDSANAGKYRINIVGTGEMSDNPAWEEYRNKVTSVDIGEGMTSIKSGGSVAAGMFIRSSWESSSLNTVRMPTVANIGDYAFYNASALTSIDMPNVTDIGVGAFQNTTALTSVNMPKVINIGDWAFTGKTDGTTVLANVNMPNVKNIGEYAFYNIPVLTSVNMPSVTNIGKAAFASTALTSVDMPNVTDIGWSAFGSVIALTRVDMPNVTSIEKGAFAGTSKLTCVRMSSSVKMCSDGDCSPMNSSNFDKIFSPASHSTAALYSEYSRKCSISDKYIICGDCEWGSN